MFEKHPRPAKIDSKLIRYALASGAVLGAPAAADASIIYTTSGSFIEQTTGGFTTLDVTLDGSLTDFTLTAQIGDGMLAGVSVSGPGTTSFVANGVGPQALTLGTLISAANATGPGGNLVRSVAGAPFPVKVGNWSADESPAYLGLAFDISGSTHYGWAQLSIDVDGGGFGPPPYAKVTVIDYAYEDQAGVGINAGQTAAAVPEPSTLALFAMGAAGVMALRRKRQSKQN